MRVLALACLLPLPALADCPGQVVFSCPIGAKHLQLCLTETDLIYSYGKIGAPDLTLREGLSTVAYQPWPGFGRTIWDSVRFQNADVSYEVWSSIDKQMSEDEPPQDWQGGVIVTRGDETLADLSCSAPPDPPFLDVLMEAKKAAGQCWDFEVQGWAACG